MHFLDKHQMKQEKWDGVGQEGLYLNDVYKEHVLSTYCLRECTLWSPLQLRKQRSVMVISHVHVYEVTQPGIKSGLVALPHIS